MNLFLTEKCGHCNPLWQITLWVIGFLFFPVTAMSQTVQLNTIWIAPQWHKEAAARAGDATIVAQDRYGEPIYDAAEQGGASLQQALLAEGKAVVYSIEPKADLKGLITAEETARQQQKRLWHDEALIIPQRKAAAHLYQFRLVYGEVTDVVIHRDQAFINFGEEWKSDFTVYIPAKTLRRMDPAALANLKGQCLLARGLITPYYGPRITLFHPELLIPYARANQSCS